MGFVTVEEREIVVAFAGSRTPQDWAFNLLSQPARFTAGLVHGGFLSLFNALAPKLHESMLPLTGSGQPLRLTGHSRGGCLAVLAAFALREAGHAPASVWLFGSPRFADAAFAAAFSVPVMRFENAGDVVPLLAPSGFPPLGMGIRLLADGTAILVEDDPAEQARNQAAVAAAISGFPALDPGVAAAHSIASYRTRLSKAVASHGGGG